ncbi:hypothetical protein BDR03DRAFT_1094850 [Suillus americanus]|nr:hypothetical protein BDR03DRAFT_1094850 [Suillus americanus]
MFPAGETDTSSTPPRANAPAHHASTIESTPNNRGAPVVNEKIGLVGVQAKEVRPWIQRGIEQVKQCMADAMLQALLQRASCAPDTKQPELLQKCPMEVVTVCNVQASAGDIYSPGVIQDWVVAKIFLGKANRTSELEILKQVEEIAKLHDTVKDHSREFLWHHTFTNATSAIREAPGVPPTTGSHVLYILVFRKLHPITKLQGKGLFDVWRQCILCHLNLWKEGVYHQDISPGNLMWYRKNGKLIGVLNDYDLSSLANVVGPRGDERTGTVPFMALDLLSPKAERGEVEYLYRHDLESFMWVFAWVFFRYRQGVLLPRGLRPFDEWATFDAIACGEKKLFFLENAFDYQPPDLRTSGSDIDWSLWELLVECFGVLDTAAYNRRSHVRRFRLVQQRSMEGASEQTNDEESVSDMDDLLGKFTGARTWVKLSNPSPSQ